MKEVEEIVPPRVSQQEAADLDDDDEDLDSSIEDPLYLQIFPSTATASELPSTQCAASTLTQQSTTTTRAVVDR